MTYTPDCCESKTGLPRPNASRARKALLRESPLCRRPAARPRDPVRRQHLMLFTYLFSHSKNMEYFMKRYFVYILASQRNGTIYVGSTSDLIQRIWQHKNNIVSGFTAKYSVHELV